MKINIKAIDHYGFDFLLFLVKSFAENAARNFRKAVKRHRSILEVKKETKTKVGNVELEAEKKALDEFFKF